MAFTIFFSWQSDRPTREGRNFVESALETSIEKIAQGGKLEEAVRDEFKIDKDTKGVPGSPPIFQTILSKIDQAMLFVPDLTFAGTRPNGKPVPNPNVLIEYGWALKSLGHSRVVPVMNVAYGPPTPESMPFDMAHLRFPIQYNLPEGASDAVRKTERERLAAAFQLGIRTFLDSGEFTSLRPPSPDQQFPRKNPLYGQGRFRSVIQPLGITTDPMSDFIGKSAPKEVYLADGPVTWLRLVPKKPVGRTWLVQDLKNPSLALTRSSLIPSVGELGFVRSDDGCGWYRITGDRKTPAVYWVFNTGEVWIVNASYERAPEYFEFNERAFVESLDESVQFLKSLGVLPPYDWIVGLEKMQGRSMYLPTRLSRFFGHCATDLVQEQGELNEGADRAALLLPFFEKVFDACGLRRTDFAR